MAAPLIQLGDIALTFGGAPLLDGAELTVSEGERLCLVGRNGSGKSTLLKIAAGLVEPDRGERFIQPGATLRYLPQEPDFSGAPTTRAYVEAGLGPADDRFAASRLLEKLGLTGEGSPAELSGGEARRAAIARVLAPSPDILLLDEPTNHLDLSTIEWLEEELRERRMALVLMSHDRRFLTNLSRATLWLDRGKRGGLDRGFAAFEAWRDEVLAEEEREAHKSIASSRRRRIGFATASRRGASAMCGASRRSCSFARRAVSIGAGRRGRDDACRGHALGLARDRGEGPLQELRRQAGRAGFLIARGARRPDRHRRAERQRQDDASQHAHRGARAGRRLGEARGQWQLAKLDQLRAELDPDTRLADALTGGGSDTIRVGGEPRHVIGYLQDFLFTPEQARTPLHALSGGERGRLILARTFAKPSNILVLDEPTNDLDLETLDVLQDRLGEYEGVVLIVSHDRDFLDRVVSAVIAPAGGGRWLEYAGGYTDMLAQRGEGFSREASSRKAAPKPAEAVPPKAAAPKPAKRRLSFNETHALATLPGRIAALERQIAGLRAKLEDRELYAKDPRAFEAAAKALAEAQSELAGAETQWLELEILREELTALSS